MKQIIHIILGIMTFTLASYASSNDALLELLVKKGVLTDQEAGAVREELRDEKAFVVKAKGKETVELVFSGRLQGQFDSLSMTGKPGTSHFYFRRLFFGAKANLQNGFFAEAVLDLARDGEAAGDYGVNLDKAVAGYKFHPALTGIIGFQKVPFGFEETTSSAKIPTIERSAANRFFADDIDFSARHAGFHFKGDLGAGLSYAAAVVNAAQGEGSRLLGDAETCNDLAAFGRVQWKSEGLLLGVDGGFQPNNAKISPVSNAVKAVTGYVNYKADGLNLLGEYFHGDMEEAGDAKGYALRASYRTGKFEPVIRYSHLENSKFEIDSDELIRRAPKGGTLSGKDNSLDSYYAGFNYHHNDAVQIMLGYENATAKNDSNTPDVDVDGFRARVQVLW